MSEFQDGNVTVTGFQQEILHREFDMILREGGDGRTLEGRIVPFGEVATVSDGGPSYREAFVPGAFKAQLAAPNRVRVWLNFQHEQGLRGIIGNGVHLEERNDGLHGVFRVHANADGDKALQLFHEGLATKMSGEFVARRSVKKDGVVQRVDARVVGAALVPEGAYNGAEVLAVRAADEDLVRDEFAVIPTDAALVQRFERYVGVPPELQVPLPYSGDLAERMAKRGISVPVELVGRRQEREAFDSDNQNRAAMQAEMDSVAMLKQIIPAMERYIAVESDPADAEKMQGALDVCRALLEQDQQDAAAA